MASRLLALALPACTFSAGLLGAALAGAGAPVPLPDPALCDGSAAGGPADRVHRSGFEWLDLAADSHAMGRWHPHPVHDTCSQAFHDSFFVVAPDGRRYPTWHPPTATDPATGQPCTFGHEHGRDPRQSQLWRTGQIQRSYFWDANGNGEMDDFEAALAGVPFGWVAETADAWFQAQGIPAMRHEDHVGHKIEWANGEPDIATHGMSSAANGGVWIGRLGDGVMAQDTGMRCFFLAKAHQGVSTADAFTHNLHEVLYLADCRHRDDLAACGDPDDLSSCPDLHPRNHAMSVSVLQPFGRSGGFTRFMPMCGVPRRNDPQDFVAMPPSPWSPWYPDGEGDREIVDRACVETGFLVPPGQWSQIMYEAWPASLSLRRPDGSALVSGVNLLFDVMDAVRYHYPEALKLQRGYHLVRPELAGTHLGYSQDLCRDDSLAGQGRRARGGACDWSTQFGAVHVEWDDPAAGFRGLERGAYFQPADLDNAGGPTLWFTDPFGRNAGIHPFPGALPQHLSARDVRYSQLIGGAPIDPRVAQRSHDDGGGTVHAPN